MLPGGEVVRAEGQNQAPLVIGISDVGDFFGSILLLRCRIGFFPT